MPRRRANRRRIGGWRRLRRIGALTLLGLVAGSLLPVVLFRWLDPPTSSVMLQRLAAEGVPQRQVWVDIDRIDPAMALAVVAAEDQRFPEHWGFDTTQIIAALERHLDGAPLRGASTISQQVARNLFLWQGRSLLRKTLEAWFTGLIELVWPKRRILEVYLNIAETGQRMFGVAVASKHYFGVTPARLGERRAALIAAALPNPRAYRVDAPSAYLIERRDWILLQMRNLGGTAYLDPVLRAR